MSKLNLITGIVWTLLVGMTLAWITLSVHRARETSVRMIETRNPNFSLDAERSPEEDRKLMQALQRDMTSWDRLIWADKVAAVRLVILYFQSRQNTAILKTPEFYAKKIDDLLNSSPGMKKNPISLVLKLAAILEYDFYNGMDKQELVVGALGEDEAEAHRIRTNRETAQPNLPPGAIR